MHELGYLQNFDQKAVKPAMDNLVPSLQHPSFDPDRKFSLPWQAGMTGLVVNTAEAPDVKSDQRPLRPPVPRQGRRC